MKQNQARKDNFKYLLEEEKYKEIDSYGYTLRKTDTNTYKSYYNELKDVLDSEKIDYENNNVTGCKLSHSPLV